MKSLKIVWIVLGFTLISILSSCAPSVVELEEQVLPSDRLVKRLEANRRKIKTFIGTGILNVESDKLTAKGNFEVIVKKPDSIKISIYGPWGIDLAHALVTKGGFIFYDVMNNTAYKGAISNEIIRQIFKVDLSFDNLLDAFAGAVNLTEKLRLEPTDYDINEENYIMTYADSLNKVKSVYDIGIKNLSIKKFRFYKFPATLALQSTFSDFKVYDDVPLPFKIIIENKLLKQLISIDYRNITVNQTIDEINISIPSDVEIIEW